MAAINLAVGVNESRLFFISATSGEQVCGVKRVVLSRSLGLIKLIQVSEIDQAGLKSGRDISIVCELGSGQWSLTHCFARFTWTPCARLSMR